MNLLREEDPAKLQRAEAENGNLVTGRINWRSVRRAVLEIDYGLRYEYPGPVHDVRQLLMLVPVDHYGPQTLLWHEVRCEPPARPRYGVDRFGNRLCHLALPEALSALEFSVALRVELNAAETPAVHEDHAEMYLVPSPLAEPWPAISAAAAELGAGAAAPRDLAETVMHWTHAQLRYSVGATGVRTTAQEAFEAGAGVCQDFSHVMIALCREAGLPARYISGHMPDEGVMHAWVEVLLPDEAGDPAWHAFDPTHDRLAGIPYVTVAVGRDFADVSPTRGSFRAPYAGRLASVRKQSAVLEVEL